MTFQLNVNGINEPSQQHKIKSIEESIHTSENFIPYFSLNESHLKPYNMNSEISIRDYNSLRADRPRIYKGGVILYTHKDFVVDDKAIYADTICQSAMIYNANLDLIVVAIYRPPTAEESSFKQCLQKIEEFIKKHEGADIQMNGDLNFPFINWQTKVIKKGLRSDTASAQNLLNFMDTHMINQLVTEPTRGDKSILDLVLTNNQQAVHSIIVEKVNFTDHDIVWTKLLYSKLSKVADPPEALPESPLDTVNLNRADWDAIRNELSQINWMEYLKDMNVEDTNSQIKQSLTDACCKHAPKHPNKSTHKLYIPPKRRSLLKIKKRLNQKINICKYLKPPGTTKDKLDKLNKRRGQIEIEIRDSIKEEAQKKELEVINKIKTNPRAFFSYAKKKSKVITSIGPLLDKENKLQSDPTVMSNILQDQYKTAFSNPDSGEKNQPQQDTTNVPDFADINFTEEDVIKAINELGINSAPGPDKIPAKVIKECKDQLAPALVILWRRSLDSGLIPEDLLTQTIIPIFKKENKSLASNYRPISLTSHFIKIFERILRDKLIDHLETNNLITPQQHGFRRYRSTLTQLLHHFDIILQILETSKNADTIYLDLSKAFDKVNHQILLHKLEQMKITGKILTWIRAFLTNRTQQVVVNGHKSTPAKVESGVPQGTVLGPALFIIYMNNVTEYIRNIIIQLFADDSKITAAIENPSDRINLLDALKSLLEWTNHNSMKFNEQKFQLLQIGSDDSLKLPYECNDITINKSETVKDLGILVSEDFSFKPHITEISDNTTNFAAWLLRTFSTRSEEVMLLFLKTYLVPRLEYCSAAWNPHKINEIEQLEAVQRSFTSRIDNMEQLNYWERLAKLKLFSLQRRRERFLIIHTWKIFKELAPNDLHLKFHLHPRLGIQADRLPLKAKSEKVKTLRHNFFSHSGPRLFNLIPGQIKSAKTIQSFKNQLDRLLMKIPDYPPIPGYKRANSNSLVDWVSSIHQAKAEMFSTSGSVSTSRSVGGQELMYEDVETLEVLDED